MRLLSTLVLLSALAGGTLALTQSFAQPPGRPPVDAAEFPPMGSPVLPDTAAAERDSLMREVLRAIAGRENAPAESVFKDIRVLKGMPAGRVPRIMNVAFGKSLGVGCAHCHVVGEWDKEDRKTKQVARDMWTLMGTLNRDLLPKIENLRGKPATVNCTTCHRGASRPAVAMP